MAKPTHTTDEAKVNWLVANELEPCPPLPSCGVDYCDSDLISTKRIWKCEANYMAGPIKWVPALDYVHDPQHAVLLLPLIGWWQSISRMPDEWVSVEYLPDGTDMFFGGEMVFGGAAPDFASALCMAFLHSRGIGLPVLEAKNEQNDS